MIHLAGTAGVGADNAFLAAQGPLPDAVEADFRSLQLQQLEGLEDGELLAPLAALAGGGGGAEHMHRQPGRQQECQQPLQQQHAALEQLLHRQQLERALRLSNASPHDADASSSGASSDADAERPPRRLGSSDGDGGPAGGAAAGPAGAAPGRAAPAAQRPPLPPQLLLTAVSSSLQEQLGRCGSGAAGELARRSTCSSLGTCSDDDLTPPLTSAATPGGGAPVGGGAHPAPAGDSRCVSFAATPVGGCNNGARRASLLSRRTSQADSGGPGSPAPGASGGGAPASASTPPGDERPWWEAAWSFGTHQEQNRRRHMEDRLAASDVSGLAAFAGFKRAGFFAVFDGHSGSEAADYLQEHLLAYLSDVPPADLAAAPGAALGAAVERAEAEIIRAFSAAACNAGSTLLAALLLDDKLHVANVGDSRAVLARGTDAIQITNDHKPHDELEAARIAREHGLPAPPTAAGSGRASADGVSGRASRASDTTSDGGGCFGCSAGGAPWPPSPGVPLSPGEPASGAGSFAASSAASALAVAAAVASAASVVSSDGYLYGELAVARAIGSQHLKRDPTKRAFTHVPDIHSVQLVKEDDMLLLATDGLWDKVENSEAVTAARRCMAREKCPGACARVLADRAVRHDSHDNISVVVVCLHDRGVSLPKTNSMLFRRLQLQGAGSGGCDGGARSGAPSPAPGGGGGGGARCDTPPC